MKLYSYFRSSAAFRVRIALDLKHLNANIVPVHLLKDGGQQYSPDYLCVNPQGLVPAFEDEGRIVTQSLAILEYLEECYPQPSILPTEPILKAQSRSIALFIACDIHPLNNLRILNYLTQDLGLAEEKKNAWYHHWINIGFTALEAQLSKTAHLGAYCVGDTPTFADICLIPQMANAHRFKVDLSPYPRLQRIEETCLTLPAFINAQPANQPDAE